ncbi:hypothetical protein ABPG77_010890 [Micractinium sp. CCAP 211/92]
MPGVQCVICLASDTSTDDWCALKECGHVFHTHCAAQALEHSRRCPQCRTDYSKRKYGASNPPYKRVFFEFSEEASQPDAATGRGPGGPAGAAGGEAAAAGDPLQLAFLQGQLRDKERRIQAVSTHLAEAEERGQRLERDLELARLGLQESQARLQDKIAELSREHKQVKVLANQLANAQSALKAEQSRASLLALATDHTLAGSALAAEVEKLVRLGMRAPNDFWERLMSERSQLILAASNRHAREKAALERAQADLQATVQQLQDQVASLKRSLAAARQHQTGSALPESTEEQHAALGRHAVGTGGLAAGRTRHRVRRLVGSAAAAASAEAAVEEVDDPLVRSYNLLGMLQAEMAVSLRGPQRAQQAEQEQQTQQAQQAQQRQSLPAPAAASGDEDDVVVLDCTEEQDGGPEGELLLASENKGSQAAQQAQQARGQQHHQQAQQAQQTAAGPPPAQQQQLAAPGGGSLGKRPAAAPAAPPQHGPAARGGGSQGADENSPGWAAPPAAAPLLAAAGPGRAALQHGPGRSFIRNPAAAGIGLDRGRFISSGPDGKGGVAKAYQLGGGAAPVRLAQKKLDLGGQHGPGSSGGIRGRACGSESSSQELAAAQALRRTNGLPITSFFSRQQQ